MRVAAAAGVKIGSEVTEEELQLFLEPLYRTLVFGEDYSAPALEEILYTALLTVTTTVIVEGGNIASYSDNDIKALVEQSKEQIKEDGEKALQSGEMPDDAHLEIMELNDSKARGMMAIYEMVNMEDAADKSSKHYSESEPTPDFYVGPNGKVLPSQYKDCIGTNRQQELLSQAENSVLKNAIKELYRGVSFIDDGGTAGVIRFEQSTGLMLGKNGRPHTKKGEEMARYLENKILTQDLSPSDRALAVQLLEDLKEALGRW